MNRKIKFRAWAYASKQMFYPDNNEGWNLFDGVLHELPNTTLMQFTGRKDKNNKEIYEGDAFNCIYHRDGHTDHHYYVIFNEFTAAFEYQRVGNPCPQNEVSQGLRDAGRGEIIGNIHENPELI